MKHLFRVAIVGLFILFIQQNAFCANNVKVGILDMQKLQMESKNFKKVAKRFEDKFESLKKKIQKEQNILKKAEEEWEKQSSMLSSEARETKRIELEKKRMNYKHVAEDYSSQLRNAELEVQREVGKDLDKIVKDIGDKKGYTIILERRTIGLVYYADGLDITDEVIKAYDALKR
jgi:outer membrane protein